MKRPPFDTTRVKDALLDLQLNYTSEKLSLYWSTIFEPVVQLALEQYQTPRQSRQVLDMHTVMRVRKMLEQAVQTGDVITALRCEDWLKAHSVTRK